MSEDILHPEYLVIPKYTTSVRDTMVAEIGTIIYDITQSKLSVCVAAAASSTSWEDITSE